MLYARQILNRKNQPMSARTLCIRCDIYIWL